MLYPLLSHSVEQYSRFREASQRRQSSLVREFRQVPVCSKLEGLNPDSMHSFKSAVVRPPIHSRDLSGQSFEKPPPPPLSEVELQREFIFPSDLLTAFRRVKWGISFLLFTEPGRLRELCGSPPLHSQGTVDKKLSSKQRRQARKLVKQIQNLLPKDIELQSSGIGDLLSKMASSVVGSLSHKTWATLTLITNIITLVFNVASSILIMVRQGQDKVVLSAVLATLSVNIINAVLNICAHFSFKSTIEHIQQIVHEVLTTALEKDLETADKRRIQEVIDEIIPKKVTSLEDIPILEDPMELPQIQKALLNSFKEAERSTTFSPGAEAQPACDGDYQSHDYSVYVRGGCYLVSLIITIVSATTGKKIDVAFIRSHALSKAMTETASEIEDFFSDSMRTLFGLNMGKDATNLAYFAQLNEEALGWQSKGANQIARDPVAIYAVNATIKKINHAISIHVPNNKVGLKNLQTSLGIRQGTLTELTRKVATLLASSASRQETSAIHIYGIPGIGKTTFATNYLLPQIAQKLNVAPDVYSINFSGNDSNYWNEYAGQSMAFYDEFLARGKEDPIIPKINEICSQSYYNLEGAYEKTQPCRFQFLACSSNSSWTDLNGAITPNAHAAFWGRLPLLHIEHKNTVQLNTSENAAQPIIDRDKVKNYAKPDWSHLRFTWEQRESAGGPRPRSGKVVTADQVVDECVARIRMFQQQNKERLNKPFSSIPSELMEAEFTTHKHITQNPTWAVLYRSTSQNPELDMLTDWLNTGFISADAELLSNKIEAIKKSPPKGIDIIKLDAEIESKQMGKETLKTLAYAHRSDFNWIVPVRDGYEHELSSWGFSCCLNVFKDEDSLSRVEPGILQSDDANKLVILFTGPPNSGKSYKCNEVAQKLNFIFPNMPRVNIVGSKFKEIYTPSIVTASDSLLYFEEWCQFYDSLPVGSIVLASANLEIVQEKQIMKRVLGQIPGVPPSKPRFTVYHNGKPVIAPPGWYRRIGISGEVSLPSTSWFGDAVTVRTCDAIHYTMQHMQVYRRDFRIHSVDDLVEQIIICYRNQIKKSNELITIEVENFDNVILPESFDVDIQHPTAKELWNTLSTVFNVTKTYLNPKPDKFIKISRRVVMNDSIAFDASMFVVTNPPANLSDILGVAKQTFAALNRATENFTVRIKVEGAEVIGIDNNLYFCTNMNAASADMRFAMNGTDVEILYLEGSDCSHKVVLDVEMLASILHEGAKDLLADQPFIPIPFVYELMRNKDYILSAFPPVLVAFNKRIVSKQSLQAKRDMAKEFAKDQNSLVFQRVSKWLNTEYKWVKKVWTILGIIITATVVLVGAAALIKMIVDSVRSPKEIQTRKVESLIFPDKFIHDDADYQLKMIMVDSDINDWHYRVHVTHPKCAREVKSYLSINSDRTSIPIYYRCPDCSWSILGEKLLMPFELYIQRHGRPDFAFIPPENDLYDWLDEDYDLDFQSGEKGKKKAKTKTIRQRENFRVDRRFNTHANDPAPVYVGRDHVWQAIRDKVHEITPYKPTKIPVPSPRSLASVSVNQQGISTLTPIQEEDNPTLSAIQKKVVSSIFIVQNSTGMQMHGMAYKQDMFIFPSHLLGECIDWRKEYVSIFGDEGTWRVIPLSVIWGQEICLGQIVPHDFEHSQMFSSWSQVPWQSKPDLTKYFTTEAEVGAYHKGILLKPKGNTLEVLRGALETHSYQEVSTRLVGKTPFGGTACHLLMAGLKGPVTQQGDCGLPYLIDDVRAQNHLIYGFHFMMLRSTKVPVGTVITQETLSVLEGKFKYQSIEKNYVKEPQSTLEILAPDEAAPFKEVDSVKDLAVIVPVGQIFDEASEMPHTLLDENRRTDISIVGYIPSIRPPPPKNLYQPSPWSADAEEIMPNFRKNAALSLSEVKDTSMLEWLYKDGQKVRQSIPWTQIAQYSDPWVWDEGRQEILDRAGDILKAKYDMWYCKHPFRTLTESEALNGIYAHQDPYFDQLTVMDMSTSAGVVWNRLGKSLKKDLVENVGTTRAHWKFKNDSISQMCRASARIKFDAADSYRVVFPAKDNLKAELVNNTKAEQGRSRVFVAVDMVDVVFTRRVMGTWMAAMKMGRDKAHAQIGIDPITEFSSLYERFRRIGIEGHAGDYKAFDKHQLAPVIEKAFQIILELMSANWQDKYVPVEYLDHLISVVADDYIRTLSICEGVMYVKGKGNPSGNVLTTCVNSIVNDLMVTSCCLELADKQDFYPTNPVEWFKNNIDWVDLGDDLAMVFGPEAQFITFPKFMETMGTMFSITLTHPSKEEVKVQDFYPITELSFLSRTFTPCPGLPNVIFPKIKTETISQMIHWVTSDTEEHYREIWADIFVEAALHGSKFYNDIMLIASRARRKYRIADLIIPQFGTLVKSIKAKISIH